MHNSGRGEILIQPGDVGQDVGPEHPAVAVAVRRGDHVGDALLHAEAGQRQRLVERPGPVIDGGQDVAVKVEHGLSDGAAFNSRARLPERPQRQ